MSELSEKVLSVTTEYIGPAAKVFLERQTTSHMGGLAFDQLEKKHIPDLAKWINISAGLLIGAPKALELSNKVKAL